MTDKLKAAAAKEKDEKISTEIKSTYQLIKNFIMEVAEEVGTAPKWEVSGVQMSVGNVRLFGMASYKRLGPAVDVWSLQQMGAVAVARLGGTNICWGCWCWS